MAIYEPSQERILREIALAHAVTLEAAFANGPGASFDATRVINVAKEFKNYLLESDSTPIDPEGLDANDRHIP